MKPWRIDIKNKKTYDGEGVYVGRPTALGNPFHIGKDGSRVEVIEKYREWLSNGIGGDNPCTRAFVSLFDEVSERGELTLICWCSPQACHAEVIRDLLMEAWRELEYES